MVINHGSEGANCKPHPQPDRLAFHKKIHVAVAVLGKRARAEKHDDADHQHPQDSEEQKISALPMHLGVAGKCGRGLCAPTSHATNVGAQRPLPHWTPFHLYSDFFGFVCFAAGMTSFCPIFNLCASSILFAASNRSDVILNLRAIETGVSPFATT